MLSDISYSKDLRAEENLHLATKGFSRKRTAVETLRKWNRFLNNCGLPEVDVVGTGLPDALRNQLSIAAATIVEMSRAYFASWNANAGQRAATPSVDAETALETTESLGSLHILTPSNSPTLSVLLLDIPTSSDHVSF